MNDKCKYCLTIKTCPEMCEENSIYCKMHRRFPKNVDKTFSQLQEENQKYKEVIDKLNNELKQYKEDLIAYQDQSINHQNVSVGHVGIKIKGFEEILAKYKETIGVDNEK